MISNVYTYILEDNIYVYITPCNITLHYMYIWTLIYIYILHIIMLYIYNIPGSSKRTAILSHSLRRNLHAPFPQIQCCYMALLGKALTGTTISARMPACIGQQHWSRGRGGIRCDVTTCRRMAAFFWRTRENFSVYGCANTSLNKFPFAFDKTSIQTHFHLQSCYPKTKKEHSFFLFMDVQTQAWTNSLLHLTKPQSKHTFIFKAATPKRRRNIVFFGLWMCKHKLEQIPFCIWQNLNPNTLSSSKLLPQNEEGT